MRLPNGFGGVTKLSGNRRKPYIVRKTIGWRYDTARERYIQEYRIVGYTATRKEGLQLLAQYNEHPIERRKANLTFSEIYDQWAQIKFPTISESNVLGYKSIYKV